MPQPVEGLPDFSIGDLAVHFQNGEVTVRGEPARLSPVEYRLLQILVRNAGHVVFEHVLSIADLHPVRFRRLRGSRGFAVPQVVRRRRVGGREVDLRFDRAEDGPRLSVRQAAEASRTPRAAWATSMSCV